MAKNQYNSRMARNTFDDYLYDTDEIDFSKFSRQEINKLMLDIDKDIDYLKECYAPPKLIRHHHELLSKLIKNYGH